MKLSTIVEQKIISPEFLPDSPQLGELFDEIILYPSG